MVSADMCEHDWPGSGCKECFPPEEIARGATGLIGLRCGDVADAVFPSNFDRRQRDRLALALVALLEAAAAQGIEAPSGGETRSGSTEGKSPVAEGHAPEPSIASPNPTTQDLTHDR